MQTNAALLSADPAATYDEDFVLWMEHQLRLLRSGQFHQLDLDHLLEELEGMVKCRKSELRSRLQLLIMHLLKCQCQPSRKGSGWVATINTQRMEMEGLFEDSPSLRRLVGDFAQKRYPAAMRAAARETGLPAAAFPVELPYSVDQLLDEDFIP